MKQPKRIVYFSAGIGAGGVFRAYALHKAFKRLGSEVEFVALVLNDYYPLLEEWGVKSFVMPHARNNEMDRAELLAHVLFNMQADALISSFHITAGQGAMANLARYNELPDLKSYLVLRQFPDMSAYLSQSDFNPADWTRVFGIEPEVAGQVQSFASRYGDSVSVSEVGPTLSIWPDELFPAAEARAQLLAKAGQTDEGKPLMLVTHNGLGPQETSDVLQFACSIEGDYQRVVFSQNNLEGTTFDPEPIARYFAGVDHLVAAPGYTTYWEWTSYAGFKSKVSWLPVPRAQEDSHYRVFGRENRLEKREGEAIRWAVAHDNGATEIAETILGDLGLL
jgi:hypothetical protein